MDIFSSLISSTSSSSNTFLEMILVIFGTFLLATFIAFIYKITYKGKYYNPWYVQTLVILSVLIAIVMMIVGNNAAGAFTLMGALSIIRFRNSLKDIRDIGFILFAIAVGMAMGTKLFLFALIATLSVSLIFWIIDKYSLFHSEPHNSGLIKIQLRDDISFENIFDKIFEKYTANATFSGIMPLMVPTSEPGISEKRNEISFKITYSPNISFENFFHEIKEISGNNNITFIEL